MLLLGEKTKFYIWPTTAQLHSKIQRLTKKKCSFNLPSISFSNEKNPRFKSSSPPDFCRRLQHFFVVAIIFAAACQPVRRLQPVRSYLAYLQPPTLAMEFVNPLTGFRLDGRRPNEMRQIRGEIGVVAKADGSALFEMGNTKVIAAVYGPREVQNRSQQINNQALVRCEYSMANFSTGDRMRRPKGDRRSTEISLVIRQTLEAAIITHLMPKSQIDIFVQVLQADGGTRSACINAATLALADAGIPMRDIVTSCSAGYLCTTPLLDLNYVEDSAGGPDVTVGLLTKMDKVTLLQMDAKLPIEIFENVMQLAIEGCKAIANYIREILSEHIKELECRRNI